MTCCHSARAVCKILMSKKHRSIAEQSMPYPLPDTVIWMRFKTCTIILDYMYIMSVIQINTWLKSHHQPDRLLPVSARTLTFPNTPIPLSRWLLSAYKLYRPQIVGYTVSQGAPVKHCIQVACTHTVQTRRGGLLMRPFQSRSSEPSRGAPNSTASTQQAEWWGPHRYQLIANK